MDIILKRKSEINNSVIGELFIDNVFFCYTLEDKIRDVKIKHQTCIPEGKYEVVMNFSQRFKTVLPLLLNVPNFEGIRIHAGNTIEDTSGCILLGTSVSGSLLLHSKVAIAKFLPILKSALRKDKVYITVINPVNQVLVEEPKIIEPSMPTVNPVVNVVEKQNSNLFTISNLIKWLIQFFFKRS